MLATGVVLGVGMPASFSRASSWRGRTAPAGFYHRLNCPTRRDMATWPCSGGRPNSDPHRAVRGTLRHVAYRSTRARTSSARRLKKNAPILWRAGSSSSWCSSHLTMLRLLSDSAAESAPGRSRGAGGVPAGDHPGEDVDGERDVNPSGKGLHIRQVCERWCPVLQRAVYAWSAREQSSAHCSSTQRRLSATRSWTFSVSSESSQSNWMP